MQAVYFIKNVLAKSPQLVRLVRHFRPDAAHRRRNKILNGIDIANLSGLEFGALDRPIINHLDYKIKYADILSTTDLKEFFKADHNVVSANIVDVSFVIKNCDLSTIGEKFDYIISSHVFEHVPNPVSWLQQASNLLQSNGVLSLVIPDRRYTFDKNRPMTSVGQLLERFYIHSARPSFANIFDQHYYWSKSGPHDTHIDHPPEVHLGCAKTALQGEYHDVHCNILTHTEFADFINVIHRVGLSDLKIIRISPCEKGSNEFFVQLAKVNS